VTVAVGLATEKLFIDLLEELTVKKQRSLCGKEEPREDL